MIDTCKSIIVYLNISEIMLKKMLFAPGSVWGKLGPWICVYIITKSSNCHICLTVLLPVLCFFFFFPCLITFPGVSGFRQYSDYIDA